MRDYPVLRLMGIVCLILTAGMAPALAYAFWKETYMVLPFVGSALVGLAFSAYALRRHFVHGFGLFRHEHSVLPAVLGFRPVYPSAGIV